MPQTSILPLIMICLGGAAVALQAPINASLSRSVHSPVTAAAVSFAVGFAILLGLSLATSGTGPIARLAGADMAVGWRTSGCLLRLVNDFRRCGSWGCDGNRSNDLWSIGCCANS